MTSRLISDARMPSAPIVMPSDTATVLNSIGVPPASRTPSFTLRGEAAQVEVARADLGPGVGDADQRLVQVGVGEADGLEHGARGRAARALGQRSAACLSAWDPGSRDASRPRASSWTTRRGPERSTLGYEPSIFSDGANSARCDERAAAAELVLPDGEVQVEQVFPGAAGRPRFDLGDVDVAQREHAQRLEQRAGRVGQREDDRRLVDRRGRPRNSATAAGAGDDRGSA